MGLCLYMPNKCRFEDLRSGAFSIRPYLTMTSIFCKCFLLGHLLFSVIVSHPSGTLFFLWPFRQWAAVRTCSGVIRLPPHWWAYISPAKIPIETIHGTWPIWGVSSFSSVVSSTASPHSEKYTGWKLTTNKQLTVQADYTNKINIILHYLALFIVVGPTNVGHFLTTSSGLYFSKKLQTMNCFTL